MRKKTLALFGTIAAALLAVAPAGAAGPVDGSLTMFYWDTEFKVDGAAGLNEDSAGDTGLDGDLWFLERYGVAAAYFRTDLGDVPAAIDDPECMSLDLKWKFFRPTAKNFLAFGAGWEEADMSITAGLGDTSGPRVVGEAGIGMKQVHGYGRYAWMPAMDDIRPASGPTLEDVEGSQVEVGVQWRAAPFLHLRLAWHSVEFDMQEVGTGLPLSTTSEGVLLGMGVHF